MSPVDLAAENARLRIELTAADAALDALRAERDGDAPTRPTPADREALLREGSVDDLREELAQAWAETDARCRWLARLRRDLASARAATAAAVRAEISACAEECRGVDGAFANRGDSVAEATGARTCAIVLEGRWMSAVEASVGTRTRGAQ